MTARQRYDSVAIKAHFDEHGFLVDRPIVARIGAQIYKTPHGDRVEFRPASEVFKADSLQSFAGKPLTIGHVTVTPKNAKDVVVGSCSGAGIPSGQGVEVPINVYAENAINSAKNKTAAELSVGYTSEDIEESGWGSNETGEYILLKDMKADDVIPAGWVKFDAVQTNIKVNHIAMVFRGRAGIAKLNLDSIQEMPYYSEVQLTNEDLKMVKIKIDSAEVEVSENVAQHIATIQAAVATAQGKADGLEAERDILKSKLDGVPAQIEEAVKKVKADISDHSAIVTAATEIGIKCDGLDTKAIKAAYVKEVFGNDVSTKTDAYIDNAFDMAKESDKMAAQRKAVHGDVKEDGETFELPDPNARFNKIK